MHAHDEHEKFRAEVLALLQNRGPYAATWIDLVLQIISQLIANCDQKTPTEVALDDSPLLKFRAKWAVRRQLGWVTYRDIAGEEIVDAVIRAAKSTECCLDTVSECCRDCC